MRMYIHVYICICVCVCTRAFGMSTRLLAPFFHGLDHQWGSTTRPIELERGCNIFVFDFVLNEHTHRVKRTLCIRMSCKRLHLRLCTCLFACLVYFCACVACDTGPLSSPHAQAQPYNMTNRTCTNSRASCCMLTISTDLPEGKAINENEKLTHGSIRMYDNGERKNVG